MYAHRMAHRRRRRHARKNPLSDTTKIILAVGATAVVVGGGYYLFMRPAAASTGGGGGGGKTLPPGGGTQPPGPPGSGGSLQDPTAALAKAIASAAALKAAQAKFTELWPNGEIYAFQMAIGAVQALGIPPQDVIEIARQAVVAFWLAQGAPPAKAEAFATGTRDNAGFGPLGAAGALLPPTKQADPNAPNPFG